MTVNFNKENKKFELFSVPPLLPILLPEEDCFLFATKYADWIEGYFVHSGVKVPISGYRGDSREF